MKVYKWDDYYEKGRCPNCGRRRLMTAHTDHGVKRVCEKCNWCVEDNEYFLEDDEMYCTEKVDYKYQPAEDFNLKSCEGNPKCKYDPEYCGNSVECTVFSDLPFRKFIVGREGCEHRIKK